MRWREHFGDVGTALAVLLVLCLGVLAAGWWVEVMHQIVSEWAR